MTDIALIFLASGLSKRFDDVDKLLASFKGRPLLDHAKRTALKADFIARFAVIPEGAVHRQKRLKNDFILIENEDPQQGQGHSLALCAEVCLNMGYNSACVMLADMPFVTPKHVKALLAKTEQAEIVMSRNGKRTLPPAVFSGKALEDLTQLSGDKGASSLDFLDLIVEYVEMSDHMAIDIDTPEDLTRYGSLS